MLLHYLHYCQVCFPENGCGPDTTGPPTTIHANMSRARFPSPKALEIQYPGEEGFYIGRPMVYEVTKDYSSELNIGKEGAFTFGPGKIVIDGTEYYDSVFESPSGPSHFHFRIDPAGRNLYQKGLEIGDTKLVLNPEVLAVDYPLSPGDSWSQKADLEAENIQIPGLDLPLTMVIEDAEIDTEVSSDTIDVPAGTFDALLVETVYSGRIMVFIPATVTQRTWLSEDNITLKRNFELSVLSNEFELYEIQLSSPTLRPWDPNGDGRVDIQDVVIVMEHWGEQIVQPAIPNPDIDGNGIVDIFDLVHVGIHFNETYTSAAPGPYVRAADHSAHLAVLAGADRKIKLQSHRVSQGDLVGINRILRRLDLILAEHPSQSAAKSALFQSFPNPCNPEAWLPYSLTEDSTVMIRIHDASGRLVRELELGPRPAGTYTSREEAAHWNGMDADGEAVASGVYFYTMRAGGFAATKKMLVSR